MKAMTSLIHRELLEHKGAFLYAPAALLGLFTLTLASAFVFNKVRVPIEVGVPTAVKFYEMAFLGTAGLWFVYLMIALFFYYADAFNADRRNNAMLFWKSMPVSDFGVLTSKMLSGLTLFPALIFFMLVITGLVLYGMTGVATIALPRLIVPTVPEIISSSLQVGAVALVFFATAMLWYAPFFAWVGMLSTLVGRWSIPLAFLIPGLAILAENLFVRGLPEIIGGFLFGTGPRGGYIADFLGQRAHFGPDETVMRDAFLSDTTINAGELIQGLFASVDWAQLVGGLIFAALLVFAASEYRRRVVAT
jgi:ABC-2 type transport system permease protein